MPTMAMLMTAVVAVSVPMVVSALAVRIVLVVMIVAMLAFEPIWAEITHETCSNGSGYPSRTCSMWKTA